MNRLKLALTKTPGIVLHGRVNQAELAEAMLSASVWFYPTWFSETSCITAMEAQAAGLICVCPPIAALAETTSVRLDDVVVALRATERPKYDPDRFSLDTLATEWDARLRAVAQQVVPAFTEPEAAQ